MDDDDDGGDEKKDSGEQGAIQAFLNEVLDETMKAMACRKNAITDDDRVITEVPMKSGHPALPYVDPASVKAPSNGAASQTGHSDVVCSEPVAMKTSVKESRRVNGSTKEHRPSRRPFYLSLLNPFYCCYPCLDLSVED